MRPDPANQLESGNDKRSTCPRRGAVLVATLACMAVVLAIVGGMLRGALLARRHLRAERDLRQAELLVEAGADRAAAKLKGQDDYFGEMWSIPESELLNSGAASVEIAVDRNAGADSWLVRVSAEYPSGVAQAVRRSRTFVIDN